MACVDDRGALTPVAAAILRALGEGASAAVVAGSAGLPLYRVRAGLRELLEAGLVRERDEGTYARTERGAERLAALT